MKNILILLALLVFIPSNAQEINEDRRISFGLYQDPSLALVKDDYGNEPFTADIRFEFMMEGAVTGAGSVLIGLTFEYADLSQYNLVRYGLQGGYNFRNLTLPFNLGYFDNAVYGGAGAIMRNFPEDNQGFISLELTNDFQVFITPWLSANFKSTLMQRGDLAEKGLGNDEDVSSFRPWDWRFNNYIGLKFYIDTALKK